MNHLEKVYKVSTTCLSFNNSLCGKLVSSLELQIIFDERFKVTSVQFFIPNINLLSCKSDNIPFKVLY